MPKFFVKEDETYSSCVRVYLGDPESEESTEILCIWKNDKGRNSETVSVWIISDEDRETAKKEHTKLEKELVSINDKLLGKNLAETVDIPESVAKITEEFELI